MNGIDVLFVSGPPGAGKTTVTESYQQYHSNTDQFGTGELVWGIRDGRIKSRYSGALREVAARGLHMPNDLYSKVVQERILQARDNCFETVMVTGFPHGHGDWNVFTDAAPAEHISIGGAVALNVGLETSVARMQERDIKKGKNGEEVTSPQELLAYESRYHDLMGRHAIRLDCYRQAGISVGSIFAERSPDIVLANFTAIIRKLNEGTLRHE